MPEAEGPGASLEHLGQEPTALRRVAAAQEQPAPPPNAPAPPPGAPSVSGRAMVPNLICDDDQKMAHSHIVVYGAVVAKSDCKLVLSNCEVRGGLYAERDARVVLSNCIVHGTVRVVRDAKLIADSATRLTGHVSTESGGKVLHARQMR